MLATMRRVQSWTRSVVISTSWVWPFSIHYRGKIHLLRGMLEDPANRAEVTDILSGLNDNIELSPVTLADGKTILAVGLQGSLAGILSMSLGGSLGDEDDTGASRVVKLVAGAGFEPATFRL
jgi:hypothetical protein